MISMDGYKTVLIKALGRFFYPKVQIANSTPGASMMLKNFDAKAGNKK